MTHALGLRSRNIELIAGHRSRDKTVLLRLDESDRRTAEQIVELLKPDP